LPDEDGRRVEAVIAASFPHAPAAIAANLPRAPATIFPRALASTDEAVASAVEADEGAAAALPVAAGPDPAWRTFRLFGAPHRADRVLVGAVAPAVAEGLGRGEIDGWFFLRYIDEAGRDHPRVRARRRPAAGAR